VIIAIVHFLLIMGVLRLLLLNGLCWISQRKAFWACQSEITFPASS